MSFKGFEICNWLWIVNYFAEGNDKFAKGNDKYAERNDKFVKGNDK